MPDVPGTGAPGRYGNLFERVPVQVQQAPDGSTSVAVPADSAGAGLLLQLIARVDFLTSQLGQDARAAASSAEEAEEATGTAAQLRERVLRASGKFSRIRQYTKQLRQAVISGTTDATPNATPLPYYNPTGNEGDAIQALRHAWFLADTILQIIGE